MEKTNFKSRFFNQNLSLERFINYNNIEQSQIVSITETRTGYSVHFYSDELKYDQVKYLKSDIIEVLNKKSLVILRGDDSRIPYDVMKNLDYDSKSKHKVSIIFKNIFERFPFCVTPTKVTLDYDENFLNLLSELNPFEDYFKMLKLNNYGISNWKIG